MIALTLSLLVFEGAPDLRVTMVGNAGVILSDGATSLLVDLPYESGAAGYQRYRPDQLRPTGKVVSVITHHHRDHFDPRLFAARGEWQIVGPPSVIESLPPSRVLGGDSVRVGAFDIVTLPTPHTADHRSYRVRWAGHVIQFVGDTEDPGQFRSGPRIDLLFITPWLSCTALQNEFRQLAARSIAYHLRPGGGDRICGEIDRLRQGASIELSARHSN